MKKFIAIASLAGLGLFSNAAFASDGTIHVDGEITDVTCNVVVGSAGAAGTDANATVTLPSLGANSFTGANSTAGDTTVSFDVSACAGSTAQTVTARFENQNLDTTTGWFKNTLTTGASPNVQVQVANANGNAINAVENTNNTIGATIGDGTTSGSINYILRYVKIDGAAIDPGAVSTDITYSLNYN
ncbi:major type 1 subunit fimbrin (pilin) [Silvimonas terrae]|uniref:Major type 1 subunit fimbrin (Pilin) n=1 Tax=Silvimonas terrae TaxID=300266 RepID=A0A840RHU9_9NEIS|nr:fimbrial protein [Silvimonas terrae]MBB5191842.1 major type 1 subunit fimbrin (pilin) [Silvimonas terrae]